MSYGIKNDYSLGVPVSPADLNRRADVLQAQLPGAFAALGVGVLGADDLLVGDTIAPGRALVLGSDGILVYVAVPAALPLPSRDNDEMYLHLALRRPDEIGGPDDTMGTDSRRGAPPVPFVSENDDEPDALLLAQWDADAGAWSDARPRSQIVELLLDVAGLQSDMGYDATARAKGTVASRLDALLGTGEPDSPTGEVTRAEFNALKDGLESLKTTVETLGNKIGIPGATVQVDDVDRYLVRDVARLEVEATRLDPPFSLETDASIVIGGVAGDGYDLGSGLTSRDVHSGNTHLDVDSGEES